MDNKEQNKEANNDVTHQSVYKRLASHKAGGKLDPPNNLPLRDLEC